MHCKSWRQKKLQWQPPAFVLPYDFLAPSDTQMSSFSEQARSGGIGENKPQDDSYNSWCGETGGPKKHGLLSQMHKISHLEKTTLNPGNFTLRITRIAKNCLSKGMSFEVPLFSLAPHTMSESGKAQQPSQNVYEMVGQINSLANNMIWSIYRFNFQ